MIESLEKRVSKALDVINFTSHQILVGSKDKIWVYVEDLTPYLFKESYITIQETFAGEEYDLAKANLRDSDDNGGVIYLYDMVEIACIYNQRVFVFYEDLDAGKRLYDSEMLKKIMND